MGAIVAQPQPEPRHTPGVVPDAAERRSGTYSLAER